jgi:hypothetical protein
MKLLPEQLISEENHGLFLIMWEITIFEVYIFSLEKLLRDST